MDVNITALGQVVCGQTLGCHRRCEWAIIEPRAHFFSQIFFANAVSDHDAM